MLDRLVVPAGHRADEGEGLGDFEGGVERVVVECEAGAASAASANL